MVSHTHLHRYPQPPWCKIPPSGAGGQVHARFRSSGQVSSRSLTPRHVLLFVRRIRLVATGTCIDTVHCAQVNLLESGTTVLGIRDTWSPGAPPFRASSYARPPPGCWRIWEPDRDPSTRPRADRLPEAAKRMQERTCCCLPGGQAPRCFEISSAVATLLAAEGNGPSGQAAMQV
jgi:hypothetical protein